METKNKVVFLLLMLNLVFFLLFFAGISSLHSKAALIGLGLPYFFIDWLVVGLSMASMVFVDYQLYRL